MHNSEQTQSTEPLQTKDKLTTSTNQLADSSSGGGASVPPEAREDDWVGSYQLTSNDYLFILVKYTLLLYF